MTMLSDYTTQQVDITLSNTCPFIQEAPQSKQIVLQTLQPGGNLTAFNLTL